MDGGVDAAAGGAGVVVAGLEAGGVVEEAGVGGVVAGDAGATEKLLGVWWVC